MRFLVLLFATLFLLLPAHAQTTSAEPTATPADELIRILEDDSARAELIERLRQAAPGEVTAAPEAPPDLSIARQLAEYTRSVAQGASQTVRAVGGVFTNMRDAFNGTLNADLGMLRDLAVNLGIVLVGLFGSFFLLSLLAGRLSARIATPLAGRSLLARIVGLGLVLLIDAATIIIAWALGYVLALNAGTMPSGQMGINQTLLLNAFLVVELSKLAVRAVLAPRYPSIRILPVSDDNSAYWSFWAARIISLLGYTFMFVAPMLNGTIGPAAGAAVQVLVMATAVTIGIIIVLQNRDDVRNWLAEIAARRGQDGAGRILVIVGRHWHELVIIYLLALLVVWFANPDEALPFMLGATAQSLIAIAVGVLITSFVGRFVTAGLSLPEDVRKRLPLLEGRLRAFVPGVMTVVIWVVVAGVIIAIGQAWALFDFAGWVASDEGLAVAGSVVSAALIVLVAIVLHVVVASWVEYRLNTTVGKVPTPREKTLLNLFKNAFTIALAIFGLMLALAQIGVNIAPLLAGAGVVGLAIGFGAQKLVQDIITGIFIQFENVMNEGDVVEVAGRSGVVEKLTIRSVTIRDMSGTIHLIPFSSVDQVSNMVRGFSFYVAEVEVAYDSDIEVVKQTMRDAFTLLMETEHNKVILDDLDLPGLIALTPSSMKLRARIKTLAGKQWGPGRFYSETLKRLFAERDIRTPTPRVSYVPGAAGHLTDEGSG
ncbi:Moderate conductance mechanosensitive channel YbiO precursor [Devosia equisanguinis]|uniref:Moderate conductance mechanosensitive channel YbiO n=1 Tax=Devosia equisanguinis TaxID=2490941 RepID=A0A447I837_9HYPH|nr:mechanosensitive ion channel domain-containing protein [Devosia equisanguinis]VDS03656.1 Moderate conductance mechanosensitive channel YbiO precursor [Devosia equisanguinis]